MGDLLGALASAGADGEELELFLAANAIGVAVAFVVVQSRLEVQHREDMQPESMSQRAAVFIDFARVMMFLGFGFLLSAVLLTATIVPEIRANLNSDVGGLRVLFGLVFFLIPAALTQFCLLFTLIVYGAYNWHLFLLDRYGS